MRTGGPLSKELPTQPSPLHSLHPRETASSYSPVIRSLDNVSPLEMGLVLWVKCSINRMLCPVSPELQEVCGVVT